MSRLIMAIGLLAGVSGCARPQPPACATGAGTSLQVFTLFFGKAIPGRGELTDDEWRGFVETTISANLPDGYTVFDANGGWLNPITRQTVRENTKVLIVALPDAPESLLPVNRVRAAYQTEFRQQLVGMTLEHACGSF